MKYVFALINLVLAAASLYFCAEIVYKTVLKDTSFIPEIRNPAAKPANTVQKREKKDIPRQGHEIIVQRNLFKVETEKKGGPGNDPAGAKDGEKLEPTTLSLTLWGTVTGGSDLYAVIEDKKARVQALYQEGNSVQDATIKKILKREIILSYQGKDQVLEMEAVTEKDGLVKKPMVQKAFDETTMDNQLLLTQPPVQPPPQQPFGNTDEIKTKIKFRPFFTKGQPDGVMVYAIKPESVFNRAGMRNGDIVKAIDGAPVSSVEDASSLLAGIENADFAKITLVRNGETKEISYGADNALAPGDEEPEKAEISDDKNKGEE